jgi:hypothetical protein
MLAVHLIHRVGLKARLGRQLAQGGRGCRAQRRGAVGARLLVGHLCQEARQHWHKRSAIICPLPASPECSQTTAPCPGQQLPHQCCLTSQMARRLASASSASYRGPTRCRKDAPSRPMRHTNTPAAGSSMPAPRPRPVVKRAVYTVCGRSGSCRKPWYRLTAASLLTLHTRGSAAGHTLARSAEGDWAAVAADCP